MSLGTALFWVGALLLTWVYAGYPLLAAVVARVRPFRVRADGPAPASLTVGIAAFNEASQLEARVADVLAQRGVRRVERRHAARHGAARRCRSPGPILAPPARRPDCRPG
jgi:hypothetical protein